MNPNGLSATHTTNPYSTLKPSLECFTFPNVLERWAKGYAMKTIFFMQNYTW